MKIQIVSRWEAKVLFECETGNIKLAAEIAVKSGANLYGANLSGANLYGADLSRANLSGADLSGANLYGADLSRADLSGANLYGADLSRADLYGANLYGADLSGANLYGADLSGADLYGEKLTKNPVQILGLNWLICITDKHIQIGCQIHKAEEWFKFDKKKIGEMHSDALAWWAVYEPIIKVLWLERAKS